MKPVTLEGGRVRLEPMSLEHVDGLAAVGLDPELWRITATNIANRDEMAVYVRDALALQEAGSALPFVTVLKAEDRIIGSTRFANFDAPSLRVEIGWTWLAAPWQRTGANIEAKRLMLTHAFEVLELNRVQFKTDAN